MKPQKCPNCTKASCSKAEILAMSMLESDPEFPWPSLALAGKDTNPPAKPIQ
jgi:hypothetical protein